MIDFDDIEVCEECEIQHECGEIHIVDDINICAVCLSARSGR